MMTFSDAQAKRVLLKLLYEQGYGPYALLLDKFDINLTSDPEVPARMHPGMGIIELNVGLDMEQISTAVRHEILHEFFDHAIRVLEHLNAPSTNINDYKEQKLSPDTLTVQDLINIGYNGKVANYAMDFEISNFGYTEEDKEIARKLTLFGKQVGGLVTEDQYPGWEKLTMEEMYDKLSKLIKSEQQQMKNQLKNQEPEEIEVDIDIKDDDDDDDEPQDTMDQEWVWGSYDDQTGQFLDDDGEPYDLTDELTGAGAMDYEM